MALEFKAAWTSPVDRRPQSFSINDAFPLLVFRSTDSQLKLWNVNKPHCLRSFKGHINEKNFVGLASNGDYVACGKESALRSLHTVLGRGSVDTQSYNCSPASSISFSTPNILLLN